MKSVHTKRQKQKEAFVALVNSAIPNSFRAKELLLGLSKMDLRHFEDPTFENPKKLAKILHAPLPFDPKKLQAVWNLALCDTGDELSSITKTFVLDEEQERSLFIRYNYARKRVSELLVRVITGSFRSEHAEEAICWGRMLKETRDLLVMCNLGLVFSMGKRYNILAGTDASELVDEGFHAVMRSVDGFDINRGFKFSTYACRAIVTSMNRAKATMSIRNTKEFASTLDITPESKITNNEDDHGEEIEELRNVIDNNLAELSDIEKVVLDERYFQGKRLVDVGETVKKTKERVRQIQMEAVGKIRDYMLN